MPRLSICICTMNRPIDLAAALGSIRAGTRQPHEIVVSDDGDGSARETAARFGAIYVEGPHRGLGPNRNRAIDAASGDLIAFIDDDVIVSAGFVERAGSASAAVITTGWELNFSTEPPKKVTPHNASFLGFQHIDPEGDYRAIVVNATVFPSALFERVRFDELTRYGYEEIDMARHARASGISIRYDDELWVEHHPSPAGRDSYSSVTEVSRLYLTHKAYRLYERRPFKAAVFNVLSSAHHIAAALKNRRGLRQAIRTIREARTKQRAAQAAAG